MYWNISCPELCLIKHTHTRCTWNEFLTSQFLKLASSVFESKEITGPLNEFPNRGSYGTFASWTLLQKSVLYMRSVLHFSSIQKYNSTVGKKFLWFCASITGTQFVSNPRSIHDIIFVFHKLRWIWKNYKWSFWLFQRFGSFVNSFSASCDVLLLHCGHSLHRMSALKFLTHLNSPTPQWLESKYHMFQFTSQLIHIELICYYEVDCSFWRNMMEFCH